MNRYDHLAVEKKWQDFWVQKKTFKATTGSKKPKFYALDMFPFPSGAGLHVGHPLGYTATDIISRKKRMEGYEVLHPIGWDAFGLPAENYAIKTGVHPEVSTQENINNFRRQIQSLGFSYDWDREVNTSSSEYYKWTQWIFLQMYKKGLLYEKEQGMHWCPKCKVVCANEEVEKGTHERCGTEVTTKKLKQWMFEITKYAERLLTDLNSPNVYIFHGWGANSTSNWFGKSAQFLKEHNVHVHVPDFPNSENPTYEEWKAHFEKNYGKIWPQDVLIGHSLGGGFIQRYLSEKNITVDHIILVAPACHDHGINEIANFFDTDFDYEKIKARANKITILASDNDQFIDLKDFEKLAKNLGTELTLLPKRDHLCDPDFPEILDILDHMQRSIVDWPDKIKAMQRNWIGKSEGAEMIFEIDGHKVPVFTTRPDTLFGVTYFVLAPEHALVDKITTAEHKYAVRSYRETCASKSTLERTELNKDKTGVHTGAFAVNPVSGEKIPVLIADYVLADYGTGAVMAVPAHDERDHEFAKKYDLPFIQVIDKIADPYQKIGGELINSEFLNGLSVEEAIEKMYEWLEEKNLGKKQVNYKLHDWIFTRQRYWGEPIPFVFDETGKCYPLDESELPLTLPDTPNYEPSESGESPLAKIKDWVEIEGYITENNTVITKKIPGNFEKKKFTRETSTMPNWAGSSWYWLRYMDAENSQEFCSAEAEKYWGPIDLYVGGAEHAVLHLLYGRFWHKVLYDLGLVSTKEPFKKLVNQGLILAEDGEKMSKSKGNVVNPDEIVEQFGADTLRCYEMFMGPFEQSKAWNAGAVGGIRKFLDRVWRLYEKATPEMTEEAEKVQSTLHKTIQIVGDHIDDFKFNTAISQLMVLTNELTALEKIPGIFLETLTLLIAPFAPHMAEEAWNQLGHTDTLAYEAWPTFDPEMIKEDLVTYAVQVNGKLRGDFQVATTLEKEEVIAKAKELENVSKYLSEGEIKKEIFVPGKIVGFVV